jgi:hypothetical protein
MITILWTYDILSGAELIQNSKASHVIGFDHIARKEKVDKSLFKYNIHCAPMCFFLVIYFCCVSLGLRKICNMEVSSELRVGAKDFSL